MEIFAGVAIVIRNGKYLAVSRKDDPTAFGFAGGKCEEKNGVLETPEECALRELHEETGLVGEIDCLVISRIDETSGKYSNAYLIKNVTGEISTKEAGVVAWVDEQTLLDGPFGIYNKATFKKLKEIQNDF
jgi:ADP-ribose pyrophosphatase YjhB (NUDIX family)